MPAQGRHIQMQREKMCAEMRSQVRAQELMGMGGNRRTPTSKDATPVAGLRLLETYAGLARRGEHLLGALLGGDALLFQKQAPGLLGDEHFEVLSEIALQVDEKLAAYFADEPLPE